MRQDFEFFLPRDVAQKEQTGKRKGNFNRCNGYSISFQGMGYRFCFVGNCCHSKYFSEKGSIIVEPVQEYFSIIISKYGE